MSPLRLLFDLDGTLLDTAPDLWNSLNYCLKNAGRPPVTLESVRHMVGQGARVLLERGLVATGGMVEPARYEDLVTLFFDHYEAHLTDSSMAFDGMVTALETLQNEGHVMGVCTNKPFKFADEIIDAFDLKRFFPVITGGDSFDVKKPDPGHILKTLKMLPAKSGPSIMIGDTDNDIDAARAAGIQSIAVSFGYSSIPAEDLNADITINHFDELVPALRSLNRQKEVTP